jgi:putative ABC transport system permease protein
MFSFLSESILLCLLGGLIGLFFVFVVTFVLSHAFDFELFVSFRNVVVGIFISISIGLVSGILPAYFASRLKPVDAIRSGI